mgnify:CR=1 FL=1
MKFVLSVILAVMVQANELEQIEAATLKMESNETLKNTDCGGGMHCMWDDATCCNDGVHCCPHNFICVDNNQHCQRPGQQDPLAFLQN